MLHSENSDEVAQLRQLLRELVASDQNSQQTENFDQVSYTVKQAIQLAKEDAFSSQLSLYIAKKDFDIEKLCGSNYQELVMAIDQLLKVKTGTTAMVDSIRLLRKQMEESGKVVVSQKQSIVDNRTILLNIETSLEAIQSCLFVLDVFNKVNVQIDNGKYYSALRLLQELNDVHLNLISTFNFVSELCNPPTSLLKLISDKSIPILQNKIKLKVLQDMKNWLASIKENTQTYGREAMTNTAVKQERISSNSKYHKLSSSVNKDVSLEIAMAEENDNEIEDPQSNIDFKPLYQCILIHEFLGEKESLQGEYEEIRKIQANLLLNSVVSHGVDQDGLLGFQEFLQEMTGFFMVESAIMSSTESFRSRGIVDILWDSAVEKINLIISSTVKESTDPDVYLSMKNVLVSFMQTVESYGFAIYKLRDTMANLFDTFTELMKSKCSSMISKIIDEDDFKPVVVMNAEEFEKVNQAFKFSEKFTGPRFPKQLSCSKSFIKSCELIKDFMKQFYRFAEGFTQTSNEMDDLLKKSVDNLILQSVNSGLIQKYDTDDLFQVVQIIINLDYFNLACSEFEHILSENKFSHKGSKVDLQAKHMLKNSMKTGEKCILDLAGYKIYNLVTESEFNWLMVNIPQPQDLSSYAIDIEKYLRTTVSSAISQMTMDFRIVLYNLVTSQLAKAMLSMIMNPSLKRITYGSIVGFANDLTFLEKSIIEQTSDITFSDEFLELKQKLEYLKYENYEEFLVLSTREKKYPNVKIDDICILLDKVKPDAGIFATNSDKAKRKVIDNVIKGLRTSPIA